MSDPLNRLIAINDDEWADKPYLIELRGDPRNGKLFNWHSLPMVWREPIPPKLDALSFSAELPVTAAETIKIADYRETGSVMDDGAHVYEFVQFE